MKKLSVVMLITLCSTFVFGTNIVERQARGKGKSRSEAIKQALYDAVSQVKGVAVSSGDISVGLESSTLGIDVEGGDKTVSVDSVAIRGEGTTLKTKSGGMVKSYEVLSESETDGVYDVTLVVQVYDLQSPLVTNRKRLAVMPLRASGQVFDFLGQKTLAPELVRMMSGKLTSLLGQTNKFSILDRRYIEEFALERKILLSDAVSIEEKAKLGELMGCDYMLVGTIRRASIKKWSQFSEAIGSNTSEYEADFVFEYRVIAAATGQVAAADEISLSLENRQVRNLTEKWRRNRVDLKEMRDTLISLGAKETINSIVDTLFPIKVVKITGEGKIVFNQGGKRLVKGQIYDVFGEGASLVNPETGESLGLEEVKIGQVKITQVLRTVAYAEVVSGNRDAMKRGMLCRYKSSTPVIAEPKYKKSNLQKTNNGGVKLPFDR